MSARVLVVDDVEVNVRLLEAKLSSEYYDVLTASNGQKALDIAVAESPDLVLLDVMMPQMDGFEVCRRLKADPRTADIPVVMVTALSDIADRLRGLQAGADDFLTKPVNDTALFARVRSLVRVKRMMEELRLREDVCGRFAAVDALPVTTEEGINDASIVVLEENKLAATKISETLAPFASKVTWVTTCAEAQQAIDPTTELAIVTMTLSSGDALRFLSQLRAVEATRQIPVLLIADEGEMGRLAKGLDLGANDYLIRPIDRNELTARVRTQIRRKRLHDRLKANYQRSLELALTDALTGLYNRRYVSAHLDRLTRGGDEVMKRPAALLFDIDFFKKVNDTYGHPVGDDVLVEVAKRATHDVRNFDLVARYGGEEFLVVMPETNLPVAMAVAERLRRAIADTPVRTTRGGHEIAVTISLGVATWQGAGDTPADMLKRADDALYAAKRNGRNQVVAWAPDQLSEAAIPLRVAAN